MNKFLMVCCLLAVFCSDTIYANGHQLLEAWSYNQAGFEAMSLDDGSNQQMIDSQNHSEGSILSVKQWMITRFTEGRLIFMIPLLLFFMAGLAICIERIIYVHLSWVNTRKLQERIEERLENSGIESAKELCRNTRGPVASIYYQGFCRMSESLEALEKSIEAFGSVQVGLLERGLKWISLCMYISPAIGLVGFLAGCVDTCDALSGAGTWSVAIIAGGLKVAIIPLLFGVYIMAKLYFLKVYIEYRIDALVLKMEDASVNVIDMYVNYRLEHS